MAREQVATRIGNTKTSNTLVGGSGFHGNASVKQRLLESGYGQEAAIFVTGVGFSAFARTPRFGNAGQFEYRLKRTVNTAIVSPLSFSSGVAKNMVDACCTI